MEIKTKIYVVESDDDDSKYVIIFFFFQIQLSDVSVTKVI